ncbi:hypothetical protein [Streptomyces sp. NPDC005760]|uniref:hypothetical protein n=1 Tax=Streptomyces sp. NPDC005760 TaxID=3156718 RepID=UPI0033EF5293
MLVTALAATLLDASFGSRLSDADRKTSTSVTQLCDGTVDAVEAAHRAQVRPVANGPVVQSAAYDSGSSTTTVSTTSYALTTHQVAVLASKKKEARGRGHHHPRLHTDLLAHRSGRLRVGRAVRAPRRRVRRRAGLPVPDRRLPEPEVTFSGLDKLDESYVGRGIRATLPVAYNGGGSIEPVIAAKRGRPIADGVRFRIPSLASGRAVHDDLYSGNYNSPYYNWDVAETPHINRDGAIGYLIGQGSRCLTNTGYDDQFLITPPGGTYIPDTVFSWKSHISVYEHA